MHYATSPLSGTVTSVEPAAAVKRDRNSSWSRRRNQLNASSVSPFAQACATVCGSSLSLDTFCKISL